MDIDPSDFFRPLSETSDDNLQLLIEKIQLNKNRTEIIDLFLNILRAAAAISELVDRTFYRKDRDND